MRRLKIGVTVSPATGHLNAMTALARRLQRGGHEVICFGTPDAAKGVASAGLPFEEVCGRQFPLGSMAAAMAELSKLFGQDAVAFTMQFIQNCVPMVKGMISRGDYRTADHQWTRNRLLVQVNRFS